MFIPVIPVQEMEAWLLVDASAVKNIIGDIPAEAGLSSKPQEIEALLDPKSVLDAIIRAQTRKMSERSVLLEALAGELDLQALSALPAVQSLRRELEEGLTRQGFLRPES